VDFGITKLITHHIYIYIYMYIYIYYNLSSPTLTLHPTRAGVVPSRRLRPTSWFGMVRILVCFFLPVQSSTCELLREAQRSRQVEEPGVRPTEDPNSDEHLCVWGIAAESPKRSPPNRSTRRDNPGRVCRRECGDNPSSGPSFLLKPDHLFSLFLRVTYQEKGVREV
jgi:hypothetical protein